MSFVSPHSLSSIAPHKKSVMKLIGLWYQNIKEKTNFHLMNLDALFPRPYVDESCLNQTYTNIRIMMRPYREIKIRWEIQVIDEWGTYFIKNNTCWAQHFMETLLARNQIIVITFFLFQSSPKYWSVLLIIRLFAMMCTFGWLSSKLIFILSHSRILTSIW